MSYRLRYRVDFEPGQFEKSDATPDQGLTDALLLASIIYPPDGSLSVMFLSKDGRTGEELADIELFKVWSMLSARLAESTTLPEGMRRFAQRNLEAVRDALKAAGRAMA